MRRRRKLLPILFGFLLVAAAIALAVVLRKHAPPEPARLLPGADGYLYANLKWVRRANIAGQMPDVPHEPEYEQFIQATGFQFERDLDQAAFAIHYPPSGPAQSRRPEQARFSEVFVGKIRGAASARRTSGKSPASVENYNSVDIYSIPLEGRTLRVAILGFDTVAASNHDDPDGDSRHRGPITQAGLAVRRACIVTPLLQICPAREPGVGNLQSRSC